MSHPTSLTSAPNRVPRRPARGVSTRERTSAIMNMARIVVIRRKVRGAQGAGFRVQGTGFRKQEKSVTSLHLIPYLERT